MVQYSISYYILMYTLHVHSTKQVLGCAMVSKEHTIAQMRATKAVIPQVISILRTCTCTCTYVIESVDSRDF